MIIIKRKIKSSEVNGGKVYYIEEAYLVIKPKMIRVWLKNIDVECLGIKSRDNGATYSVNLRHEKKVKN